MEIDVFDNRIKLLAIASQQIRDLSQELNAISVSTNSSTAFSTTFTILLKKGKWSMDDVEIMVEIDFNRTHGISIYGSNVKIYKQLVVTEENISNLGAIVNKELKKKG